MNTQKSENGRSGRWLVVALIVAALALSTLILFVNRPALDGPPPLPTDGNQTSVDGE